MIPGPVRQFVVRETFTVAFSSALGSVALGVALSGRGEIVRDGVEAVGVSVISGVSVMVGLIVNVGVIEGVLDGVKVGGGSWVAVKVDLIWKGVFVEVPFTLYFWEV